jgi:hypothetical protein
MFSLSVLIQPPFISAAIVFWPITFPVFYGGGTQALTSRAPESSLN